MRSSGRGRLGRRFQAENDNARPGSAHLPLLDVRVGATLLALALRDHHCADGWRRQALAERLRA